MTLVGPSGDAMLSNGYLPEGFKVTYNASTVGTSLNGNAPAIIWERPDGMSSLAQRVRAVTITDVTDFVQEQGYGRYYGYNVPVKFGCNYSMTDGLTATTPPSPLDLAMYNGVPRYNQGTAAPNPAGPTHGSGNFADMACGWQIIVVEEDPSMEYVRAGALQLGTVYNFKEQPPVVLEADFAGFTTPYDDFTGQILFTDFGANVGINQCQVHLSPDGTGTSDASDFNANWASAPTQPGNANNGWLLGSKWVDLWTSDKSTAPKHRNRPQTPPNLEISSNSFGQSIITLDGQRRSDFSSYRTYSANANTAIGTPFGHINRADGFDAELLEVANKVPANGHHNAYFAQGAEKITLRVPQSQGGTNFIVSLGALTDISIAKFETDITHVDEGPTAQNNGAPDVYAGNKITVNASATNTTPPTGNVIGLSMTQAVIKVDESLVPDWDTLSISFYSAENDDTYTIAEYTRANNLADLEDGTLRWYYDPDTRELTINFGVDYDMDKTGTNPNIVKLFSGTDDTLDVSFEALTDETPLADITNRIIIQGKDAITATVSMDMETLEYARATDIFNTYLYPTITKDAFINGAPLATNGADDAPVVVQPGDEITYVITLESISNKIFDGITISDLVPAGLELVSVDPGSLDDVAGTPNAKGATPVSWEDVIILPGSAEAPTTNTYTIVATVKQVGALFTNDAVYEMDHNGNEVKSTSAITYSESEAGKLKIGKTVIGGTTEQENDSFSITVTVQKEGKLLSASTTCVGSAEAGIDAPDLETLTFRDGKASFDLMHGQYLTIDLPVGWDYEVEENGIPSATYSVEYANSLTGTITTVGATIQGMITNTRIYTITYMLEGGENDPDNPPSYTKSDDTIAFGEPTKEGHRFGGWFADPDCTIPLDEIPAGSDGDVVVYAKWEPFKATIENSNDDDDGTGEYLAGDEVTIKAGEPAPGMRFVGWNVKEGDVDLDDPTNPTTTFEMPYDDVVIEAMWEPITYPITYVLDGGENNPNNPDDYNVTTPTITFDDPTKPGFAFGGWFADPECTIPLTEIPEGTTGPITAYAKWDPYTVDVVNSRADDDGSGEYPGGDFVTIDAGEPELGMRFAGWKVIEGDVDLDDPMNPTASFLMPDGNVKVEAMWEPIDYEVVVNGSVADETGAGGYKAGDEVTVNAGERPGYAFTGWIVNEGDVDLDDPTNPSATFTMPYENVDVTAGWAPLPFAITYMLDGGENDPDNPDSYTIEDPTITFGDPVKPGFVFGGWFADPECTIPLTEIPEGSTGDITVYAKWDPYTVTVENSYSDDDGTGPYEPGDKVTIKAGENPSGARFLGWEVIEGDVELSDPKNPNATFIMPEGNVVVRAIWEPAIYDVEVVDSYADETGEGPYMAGDEVTVDAGERPGYRFTGWIVEEGDVDLDDPTNPKTTFIMPDGNVKVVAGWEPIEYTVVFKDWDGTELKSEQVPHGGAATPPPAPEREGFVFDGWDVSYDNITGDLIVNAKYRPILDPEDGELPIVEVENSYAPEGETGAGPYRPGDTVVVDAGERPGYRFTGWTVEGDAVLDDPNNPRATFIMPDGSVKVIAGWEPIEYTVVFKDWDGTELKSEQVPYGGSATPPPAPEREGYRFIGWDVSYDNITGDLIVTALYEPIEPGPGADNPKDPGPKGTTPNTGDPMGMFIMFLAMFAGLSELLLVLLSVLNRRQQRFV
ncbi:MAG: InlB B-repeat-containing protein [Eggerthellaceae bacterium]|nr:InlB B-repeat-containing protein [Eggerthellaceae bacterium]